MKYVAETDLKDGIWVIIFSIKEIRHQVTTDEGEFYEGTSLEDIILITSEDDQTLSNSFHGVSENDIFDSLDEAWSHISREILKKDMAHEVLQTLFSG